MIIALTIIFPILVGVLAFYVGKNHGMEEAKRIADKMRENRDSMVVGKRYVSKSYHPRRIAIIKKIGENQLMAKVYFESVGDMGETATMTIEEFLDRYMESEF